MVLLALTAYFQCFLFVHVGQDTSEERLPTIEWNLDYGLILTSGVPAIRLPDLEDLGLETGTNIRREEVSSIDIEVVFERPSDSFCPQG